MPNIVAIPLSQDPAYTHRLLSALAWCQGLSKYKVLMSMDWDQAHDERSYGVYALALSFAPFYGHPATEVRLHKPGLGPEQNKKWLIATALKESEFAVILDSGILPPPNFLYQMERARAEQNQPSARIALDGNGKGWSPVISKPRLMRSMP